jgi:cytochrome c556
MKTLSKLMAASLALVCSAALFSTVAADAEKNNPTKEFMKKYHKAPQGVDNVVKKAILGKATPEELKGLAAGYKAMKTAKPPRGEMASWTEKTTKASAAADALLKGDPGAADRFKEATNCKACHTEHKPD